ncbi:hypothetical protein J4408_01820 [Candidatus Pacearchaeota archaeon]|nr:hypothetical protein [Candidatus Pacearchaeota archaeon]
MNLTQKLALMGTLALSVGCSNIERTTDVVKRRLYANTYSSNAESGFKENSFSNNDFNSKRSEVALTTGNYLFGKINAADIITIDNRPVDRSQVFPFWALKVEEMTEHIFPEAEEVVYGRPDGKVRLFVLDDSIDYALTNRGFRREKLAKGKRVGNVKESHFYVPTVNFNTDELLSVPYSGFVDPCGEHKLLLVTNPSYRLNNQNGLVELFGNMYVEKIGELDSMSRRNGANKKDFVDAEVIYKPVNKQ